MTSFACGFAIVPVPAAAGFCNDIVPGARTSRCEVASLGRAIGGGVAVDGAGLFVRRMSFSDSTGAGVGAGGGGAYSTGGCGAGTTGFGVSFVRVNVGGSGGAG